MTAKPFSDMDNERDDIDHSNLQTFLETLKFSLL
jgi:hypothetical protein